MYGCATGMDMKQYVHSCKGCLPDFDLNLSCSLVPEVIAGREAVTLTMLRAYPDVAKEMDGMGHVGSVASLFAPP